MTKVLLISALAMAFAAGPAAAATTDVCVTPSFSQVFLPWKDTALYTKSPGGDFEGSLSGWALDAGARVTDGNESFQVGGARDRSSLVLASGASVVSSPPSHNSAWLT